MLIRLKILLQKNFGVNDYFQFIYKGFSKKIYKCSE